MELKMEVAQTLGLSQRMIQSTEILQMSAQELEVYLKEVAVENPVVDIEEKYEKPGQLERDAELQKKLEWLTGSDEQNRVYYSEEYSSDEDDNQDMWNVTDNRGEDLAEYLVSQLVTMSLSTKDQETAEYLIDLLDPQGIFYRFGGTGRRTVTYIRGGVPQDAEGCPVFGACRGWCQESQ